MADSLLNAPVYITVGQRAQQLDMLLHLQEFSSMVVLITGKAGVGKSALLNAAHNQLSIHHQSVLLPAYKLMAETHVLEALGQALHCDASELGFSAAIKLLEEQGDSFHALVDDAHLLEVDALQFLVEQACLHDNFHLVLAGDDGIEPQLRILQARLKQESLYHNAVVQPLSEEELLAFLQDLYLQTNEQEMPLSDQKVHQLWVLTEGIPAKVLELLEVEEEKQQAKAKRFPIAHVGALALIAAALYLSFQYKGDDAQDIINADDPIAALLGERASGGAERIEHSTDTLSADPASVDVASSSLLEAEDNAQSLLLDDVDDPSVDLTDAALKSEAQDLTFATAEAQGMEESIKPTPARPGPAPTALPKPTGQPKNDLAPQRPKITSKVDETANLPKRPNHPLLKEPPQTYALQLLGVRNQQSANEFVQGLTRQIGQDLLSVYQTRYQNQPWYVVVYGPFEDRNDAENAANQLPGKLRQQQPWIRQLSKIQEDIRKAEL